MPRGKEEKLYEELLHLVQEHLKASGAKLGTLTKTERKQYGHRTQKIKDLLRHLLPGKGGK